MAVVMPLFSPTFTDESWTEQLKAKAIPKLQ